MFSGDYFDGVSAKWYELLILLVCFLALIAALMVLANLLDRKRGNDTKLQTRDLTYGAVCIAISYALSFLPVYSMPYGGSITLASTLPMMLYCYYFGFKKALGVSTVYMLLQLLQRPYIISPWSALLDYLLPFIALSFVGLFQFDRKKYDKVVAAGKSSLAAHKGFFAGVAVYFVLRYFSHILAGVLFWSSGIDFMIWDGDLTGWAAWSYSIVYNGLFFIPDTLIAALAGLWVLASKSFNAFMATKANTLQNTDTAAKNDQ